MSNQLRSIQDILVEHAQMIQQMMESGISAVKEYIRVAGVHPESLEYEAMAHCGAATVEVNCWPRGYSPRPGYGSWIRVYYRGSGWSVDHSDAMSSLATLMDSTRWFKESTDD